MNFYDPIGFFYTCYKEHRAVEYSIKRLRRVYPDAPIYLVSEGADFSYLEEDYDEISTHLEEDTMSPTFHITGDYCQGNFRERNNSINCSYYLSDTSRNLCTNKILYFF